MKSESLELICCPVCKGDLYFDGVMDTVQVGRLRCRGCPKEYIIDTGIPRFLLEEQVVGMSKSSEKMYNYLAPFYDLVAKFFFAFWGGEQRARREYLDRLEWEKGSKVLEVSIGTGGNLPFIRDYAPEGDIYGLDITYRQLTQCKKNMDKWGIEAELYHGSAERLPFKDSAFDVVFHMGGINFFTDKKMAIEEMLRVTKPGRKIIVVDEGFPPEKRGRLFYRSLFKLFPTLEREARPPVDAVPKDVSDLKVDYIWKGHGYCLEFRKPQ